MQEYIQVLTTTDGEEEARGIARQIVEERLAACVQVIGPVRSTYWWEERIEESQEWLCLMKTSRGLYPALEERIRSLHSYDVPEILAVPVLKGHEAYLKWLDREVLSSDR